MLNRIMRLKRQLRTRPTDARLWIDLARAEVAAGTHTEAIESLSQATRNAAGQPDVWRGVGETCMALGWYDRALEALACAARLEPSSVEVHLSLGHCLLARGDAATAATAFAAGVWLAPVTGALAGQVRAGLARALLALGDFEAAEAELAIALGGEAAAVEPWLVRAELCSARRAWSEAIEALQRAFALEPHTRDIGLRLAEALHEADRDHEAYSVLREVHAHHAEDGDVLTAIGRIEHALDRPEVAVATLRRAAALGGQRAAWVLAGLLQAAGRHPEALAPLREAHRVAPDDAEVAATLAEALLDIEATDEAFKVLARATLSNRDDARLHALLGRACDEHGGHSASSIDLGLDDEEAGGPRLDPDDQAAFSGDLSQFNLVDLLEFLRLNRRTGTLRVAAPTGLAGEVVLVDGTLVGATTTASVRLGERLRAAGLVSALDLESMVTVQRMLPDAPTLGRLLLDRGLVLTADLRGIIASQAREAVAEVLSWPAGRFAFETDDAARIALLHPSLALDTGQLMLDVLRIQDEKQAGLRPGGPSRHPTGELGEISLPEYDGPVDPR